MQHIDETAYEYAQRVMSHLDFEWGDILDDLPSVESIFDYIKMLDSYDVEFLQSVFECIGEGENPLYYNEFVKKYNLPWKKL